MKKLVLILFALCNFNTHAQWFGRQEYYVNEVKLTSAKQTFRDSGYVMAGYRATRSNSNEPDFVVYKTDQNGKFTTPNDFSNEYQYYDGCNLNWPSNCTGVSVVETNGTTANKS